MAPGELVRHELKHRSQAIDRMPLRRWVLQVDPFGDFGDQELGVWSGRLDHVIPRSGDVRISSSGSLPTGISATVISVSMRRAIRNAVRGSGTNSSV